MFQVLYAQLVKGHCWLWGLYLKSSYQWKEEIYYELCTEAQARFFARPLAHFQSSSVCKENNHLCVDENE